MLINIGSELGEYALPYYSSYTAAKHGVVGLSTAIRQELAQNDIEHILTRRRYDFAVDVEG